MRILIAAGGTGGHVYPALAIAEALTRQHPTVKLAFVGSVDGFERPLVTESRIEFESYDEVRAGPLHGVGLLRALVSLLQLGIGTVQALLLLLRRRPNALLLTGGWVGLPVALAGWVLRVPSLMFLPDIEPGLTIRALRPFATCVALTAEDSRAYFPRNQTVVTGYPLRQQMLSATREAAQAHFRLDPTRRTLLVFGGSRGARAINETLLKLAPSLLEQAIQIIHVTGTLDWVDIERRLAAMPDTSHYHAFPYLHQEMGLAMAAADLVVSRSGASVLGEFPLFELPAILIPYPHAWRYQKVNADYLAGRGAALVMEESKMADDLLSTITTLLNDPARLTAMRQAAMTLARPDAAGAAAQTLADLAGVRA